MYMYMIMYIWIDYNFFRRVIQCSYLYNLLLNFIFFLYNFTFNNFLIINLRESTNRRGKEDFDGGGQENQSSASWPQISRLFILINIIRPLDVICPHIHSKSTLVTQHQVFFSVVHGIHSSNLDSTRFFNICIKIKNYI